MQILRNRNNVRRSLLAKKRYRIHRAETFLPPIRTYVRVCEQGFLRRPQTRCAPQAHRRTHVLELCRTSRHCVTARCGLLCNAPSEPYLPADVMGAGAESNSERPLHRSYSYIDLKPSDFIDFRRAPIRRKRSLTSKNVDRVFTVDDFEAKLRTNEKRHF